MGLHFVSRSAETPKAKTFRAYDWMMKRAAAGSFDLVLFWSLEKLFSGGARDVKEWLTKLDVLGIDWRSQDDKGFDSRENGALKALSKQESARFIGNAKKGVAKRKLARGACREEDQV